MTQILQGSFQLLSGEPKTPCALNIIKYPDGEPSVRVSVRENEKEYLLIAKLVNSDALICLLKIVDVLRRETKDSKIKAFIPYIPSSRGDRVMVKGESFNLKVTAALINSCKFDEVICIDPHSDVTPALIDNCRILDNYTLVINSLYISNIYEFTLVSPDSGANKKVKDLMQKLSVSDRFEHVNLLKADKTRDVSTGKITGFEVYAEQLDPNEHYVIVDDICDGGGTFIGLAEEMKKKGARKIHLIVSHGIFSQGFDKLMKEFKTIHFHSIFSFQDIPIPRNVFRHNTDL